jgi:predicted nucleic acid-binding protein
VIFKVVSNSTPLIALSQISRLNIIKELFGTIIIPDAVFIEVAADKKGRAGKDEVSLAKWIRTMKVSNPLAADFLSVDLDPGEAEAITLSKEINADLLLIDDKDGRKAAKSVDIPITGTVGLLLRYYKGKKEDFKLALDELIAKGFRLSVQEYEKFLMMANQDQDIEKNGGE